MYPWAMSNRKAETSVEGLGENLEYRKNSAGKENMGMPLAKDYARG